MVTERFLCRPIAVLLLINTGNDESGGIPRTKTKNDTFFAHFAFLQKLLYPAFSF
jgi:hypothetical protein